jgi:hypothetical protein
VAGPSIVVASLVGARGGVPDKIYRTTDMQQRKQLQSRDQLFTASEVAEFEYCPLVWWHEQFEPLAQQDNEELFARLVELEHEHDSQAPALPEYQVIEQLLLRKGAFDQGQQEHLEHAEEVEEAIEERSSVTVTGRGRKLVLLIVVVVILALLLIGAALLLLIRYPVAG